MNLAETITAIEALPGPLRWLLRSTERGADRDNIGGAYFAHVYGSPMYGNSYEGVGSTAEEALELALDKARKRLATTDDQ